MKNVDNQVVDIFQDKIKNNNFKNGEQISLDDAIWNIEALLNFNYSNPDSSFANLTVDNTFEFNIPVNNDMVNYKNVVQAAFEIEEHVVNYLNNMPNSIKFIIAIDVSVKENDFKNGEKTIIITTGYGSEYIDNPSCYTPFGENDYWQHGFDWGGCGTNTATSSDAAKKIEYKINNPNCQNTDPTHNTYVINLNPTFVAPGFNFYLNPNDNIQYDNWLDYLMYYEDDDNGNIIDGCLEPEEMNFYLQGTLDVIEWELYWLQDLNPEDELEFVYLFLEGNVTGNNGVTMWVHTAEITFGKRVVKVEPTE